MAEKNGTGGGKHRRLDDGHYDERDWAPTIRMAAVVGTEFDRHFPTSGRHATKDGE